MLEPHLPRLLVVQIDVLPMRKAVNELNGIGPHLDALLAVQAAAAQHD